VNDAHLTLPSILTGKFVTSCILPSCPSLRTTTLRHAASFFRREQVRGEQVKEEQGRAEGVFSYEELLNALTQGADLSESITRYMRTMLCSVHPDTEVAELKRYGSAFLTVVDNGQVVGSIDAGSVDDALKTRALASRNPSYHVSGKHAGPGFCRE
jgi:predicted transcriptional regulator